MDQGDLVSRKTWSVLKDVHLKTARVSMLSRLMIDQGDPVNKQFQYKTTLKCIMRPKRSTLTMRQIVKELRQTWTQTSIVHFAAIERERRSSTKSTMGTEIFFFFMVELARFLVDSLLWKSPWRWTKYWLNKATCYTSIWNNSSRHDFLEFIYFVTDGSFTANGGLL